MSTPDSVMDRIPESERVCVYCKFFSEECESAGRKCCNLSDDYDENYFEPDSYDWYSDCDNCKHSIDRDMGDYEVCLECKRYHEDRWEPKE